MSDESSTEPSMLELFRLEAGAQAQVLAAGLLALERDPASPGHLEACMRAAHSLKGAARIVGLDAGVSLAHAMEDCLVAAQKGSAALRRGAIDLLLRGVDLLEQAAQEREADLDSWFAGKKPEVDVLTAALARTVADGEGAAPADGTALPPIQPAAARPADAPAADRVLRVTAENLNRLLGLAGESLVESRWLKPFAESLVRLKRLQHESALKLDRLRDVPALAEPAQAALAEAQRGVLECQQLLAQRLVELEGFDRRSANLSRRLYDEALTLRMRPFADGARAFPRLVRDLGRALGKEVRLEIAGETTQVDRDILDKLDAPLGHLLRNAVDHGIDGPEERRAAGKPAVGVVRLEARHNAGWLQIVVSDDGGGIPVEEVRGAVVARHLASAETAQKLSEAEVLEFLFLPGFTMKQAVTDISGRGVGLDVVQTMVKQVRGTVRVSSTPGQGTRFQLQLPLTLSVVRTLLVDIGGEPYAFPLAHIVRTLQRPNREIELLEGRQHISFSGRRIGLVTAHQVLGGGEPMLTGEDLPIVVVGDHAGTYGLVVDRFLGERDLVVHPLDRRLGKVKDIAAAGLMEDGSPVLIVDVEDLIRSVEKLASGGRLSQVAAEVAAETSQPRKRVLVVDDSLTVRELERKLLVNRGYAVETALDGIDGWNAVRTGAFDLVITDVDMPRLDGIELVTLIRKDPNLKSLPVMVVSYKDREEDRRRGLEAGADYYLAKGGFHDETLLQAVADLIGGAEA